MLLSAKLIIYYLKQNFSLQTAEFLSAAPCLKYALLYQADKSLQDGAIYVTEDSGILDRQSDFPRQMVILLGRQEDLLHFPHSNICLIKEKGSSAGILELLQEIFDLYHSWHQDILQTLFKNPSIQNLLELSQSAIKNPMALVNNKQEILGGIKLPDSINTAPSLCVNIHNQGRTRYQLLILEGAMPLDDTILFLAEALAQSITQALQIMPDATPNQWNTLQSAFHTILTDSGADYVNVSRELVGCGWMIPHSYLCMVLEICKDNINHTSQLSIRSYLEAHLLDACALEHQGYIVIFINLSLSNIPIDRMLQEMTYYIRDHFLKAGYSRILMGHFNFNRQYQQAKLTLRMGEEQYPTRWVHHFNDIALSYIMKQMTDKLPGYMIAHERLLQLKNQDYENDSKLYDTLKYYLQNNQNATKTAQLLYIHRSTLLYRLENIRRFMKSDFSNPEENLYLLISFYLIDENEKER